MIADDDVASFVSMTGANPEEAQGYLEMVGGNLEQAVNLFLEMGGGGAAKPSSAPAPARPPPVAGVGGVVDADIAAEVAAAAAAAGIDMGDAAMGAEEEVRAPIASFQDQMIDPGHERSRVQRAMEADSNAMMRRMTFDRGEGAAEGQDMEQDAGGQAINSLFAPPDYNSSLPYYGAIEKAKADGKWLLVNIQQAEVFASHTLNRDVWRDETIQDILAENFLFWQRDDKSTEGNQFCQFHQCGHQLPHICMIDARTGRRIKSWDGRKWVEVHAAAEYLYGFLDEFSMSRSPPALSPAGSPSLGPKAQPSTNVDDMKLVGFEEVKAAAAPPAPMEDVVEAKEPPAAMPEEPPAGDGILKVSLRLPSGQRTARRFRPGDRLECMFDVASALANEPKSSIELSTQFPTRSLRELPGGLETPLSEAQVAGNMILITVRAS